MVPDARGTDRLEDLDLVLLLLVYERAQRRPHHICRPDRVGLRVRPSRDSPPGNAYHSIPGRGCLPCGRSPEMDDQQEIYFLRDRLARSADMLAALEM